MLTRQLSRPVLVSCNNQGVTQTLSTQDNAERAAGTKRRDGWKFLVTIKKFAVNDSDAFSRVFHRTRELASSPHPTSRVYFRAGGGGGGGVTKRGPAVGEQSNTNEPRAAGTQQSPPPLALAGDAPPEG